MMSNNILPAIIGGTIGSGIILAMTGNLSHALAVMAGSCVVVLVILWTR